MAQNLALVAGSILLTVLLAEGMVRLLVPRERWEFRDASADWEPDSLLGWKQRSNYSITSYDLGPRPVVFQTNVDGFRPATIDAAGIDSTDFVVLLVGNSTVNGRAVPENQTIHYFLDSLLTGGTGNAIVINASVQGYSTDQSLLAIELWTKVYKADWVVYGFCDNDLGGNMTGQAYGLNKPRFELRDNNLQLVPAEPNANISGFREASWKDVVVKSALFRLVQPIVITIQARGQGAAQQILVGANGASYYFDPGELEQYDWAIVDALLKEMNNKAIAAGARFAFYAHPAVESVWRPHAAAAELKFEKKINPFVLEDRLKEVARGSNVGFIPMTASFISHQERGPFHLLPRDTHCNGAGYLLQAEVIAAYLAEQSPLR